MSSRSKPAAQQGKPKIPTFEPLPPSNFINRLINRIVAPIFYLLFAIVTSIIVVPIYTIIDRFKHGRSSRGGERFASDQSNDIPGQYDNPNSENQAQALLRAYGKPEMTKPHPKSQ